ncbi:O-antigen ligase family protein [Pseudonocardia halophobica]|uniref:O-antigen ligase family protein n=1 Tax=Pseudonocardia halophobica TaxID=29401 RepID=UPI003D907266
MIVTAPRPAAPTPLVRRTGGWDGRATLLGTALGVAVLAQGAFYAGPFTVVAALVAGAGVLAVVHRAPVPRPLSIAAACWAGFALWVLVRGLLDDAVAYAVPAAALALLLAVALPVAAGLGGEGRRLLQTVALALAVVVAASGWVGTALHLSPLSMPSSGLWRAAATITYANAAGAALVTGLLLALVTLPAARPLLRRAVVAALVLGLAVTMSRGAVLALAVGTAVLLATAAGRRRVRGLLPVVPGVAVPCAALLPSLPDGAEARPLLALAGLVAGAAVLLAADRRRRAAAGTALGAVLLGLADLVTGPLTGADPAVAVDAIAETRLTGASADRVDLVRETLAHFATAPVTGVGPGMLDLTYVDHGGRLVHAWFTHLEYLQVAAETGLVGLALALAGAAALVAAALRARRARRLPLRAAGALAVLAAFATQSALDFLWHVPALPLLVCLAVATLLPAPARTDTVTKEPVR